MLLILVEEPQRLEEPLAVPLREGREGLPEGVGDVQSPVGLGRFGAGHSAALYHIGSLPMWLTEAYG